MSRLFAVVYEHQDFGGQYRYLSGNCSDFAAQLEFGDKVTSIRVYAGNDYRPGDVIRFYEHPNYGGGYIELGPGGYRALDLAPFRFNDVISSAQFLAPPPPLMSLQVRLVVRVYDQANYAGQSRDILANCDNLTSLGFNDRVGSIKVLAGEDYVAGWVANFYVDANYAGGMLAPGNFAPGTNIASLTAAGLDDKISSVKISQI